MKWLRLHEMFAFSFTLAQILCMEKASSPSGRSLGGIAYYAHVHFIPVETKRTGLECYELAAAQDRVLGYVLNIAVPEVMKTCQALSTEFLPTRKVG